MINIKHQSRPKVLPKFYYSKRDISATLVGTIFISLKTASTSVTEISHFE